jgi:hypothetical protein
MEQVPRECQVVSTWPVSSQSKETGVKGRKISRTFDPVFDVLDVFGRVVEVLKHVLRIRVEEAGARSLALLDGHGPGSVLDSGGDVAGKGILLSD